MKKWIAMLLALSLALFPLSGALAETTLGDVIGGFLDLLSSLAIGTGKTVSPEPSALFVKTMADKFFSSRMNGYVWA